MIELSRSAWKFAAAGAVAASLAVAGPAAAEVRSGGAPDPVDPQQNADAERVDVTYDSTAGRLRAFVRVNPANQHFGGQFRLSVGSRLADGRCVADAAGDVRIDNTLNWDLSYGTAELVGGGTVDTVSGPSDGITEDFPAYVFTYESPQLAGRDYRCVTDVSLGGDQVAPFTFEQFAPTNLVVNPSFEAGTTGWGSFQGTLSRVALAGAPDGGAVVKATRASGTQFSVSDEKGGARPTVRSTKAGATYVATAQVRAAVPASVGKPVQIVLRETTPAGATVRETAAAAVLGTAFARLAVSATAAGSGNTLGIRVLQNAAVAGNAFYADAITVRPGAVVTGNGLAGPVWTSLGPNSRRTSKFSFLAPAAADVSELRAYVDGKAATSGSQPVRGVLYAAAPPADGAALGGEPSGLVAQTSEVTIAAGQAAGWVTLRFAAPVRLPAGTYHLGLHSGGTKAVGRYAAVPTWSGLRFASDAYGDGAANPFGPSSADPGKYLSIFAVGA